MVISAARSLSFPRDMTRVCCVNSSARASSRRTFRHSQNLANHKQKLYYQYLSIQHWIVITAQYTDEIVARRGRVTVSLSSRYRIRRNRGYDVTMVESVFRLRFAAWPLVTGMIAGEAVALFAGAGLFWALVALALAALLIAQFVTFQEPIRPVEEKADDPVGGAAAHDAGAAGPAAHAGDAAGR